MCPGWNRTLSFLLLFQPQTRASLSLLHFDKLDRILSAVLAKNRGSSSFLSPFLFSSLINPFYFISKNVHRSLSALRMYSYTPLSGQGSVARRRGAADGRGRVRVSLSLCVTDASHSARCQAHTHSSPVWCWRAGKAQIRPPSLGLRRRGHLSHPCLFHSADFQNVARFTQDNSYINPYLVFMSLQWFLFIF